MSAKPTTEPSEEPDDQPNRTPGMEDFRDLLLPFLEPQIYDSTLETLVYTGLVQEGVSDFITLLLASAFAYDKTRLEEPERGILNAIMPLLRSTPVGTKAFEDVLEKLAPAMIHHHRYNRDHPEHFPRGVQDMNLVDVVIMMCSWRADSIRDKMPLREVIARRCKRYNISDPLHRMFEAMAEALRWPL